MTLQWPWGNKPVKYNPISTCLLRLGLIRCNQCLLATGQNITSVCYLDHFSHIRQYWRKDEGGGRGGEKKPSPYVITVTSQGCFGGGLCWDLGMLQAMIDITSEHNVSKNNKNQLFSAVLSWFHLAVTLRWSDHDIGIRTPLWNQTPTDVIMCTWVGLRPIYWKCWSNNVVSTILRWLDLAMTLRWPYHDLEITLWNHLPRSPYVLGLGFDLFIFLPP